jgi:hypothetical protein
LGRACPVTDLFGVEGRRLLERLQVPEPWRGNVAASVLLIDDLERQISEANCRLKDGHADHPYIPLLDQQGLRGGRLRASDRVSDQRLPDDPGHGGRRRGDRPASAPDAAAQASGREHQVGGARGADPAYRRPSPANALPDPSVRFLELLRDAGKRHSAPIGA